MSGQLLRWLGGQIDVRVEVDVPIESAGGLWDAGLWGTAEWSSVDPDWTDITDYVMEVRIDRGRERWEQRFSAGTASILVDNESGIFTPESTAESPWFLPWRPGRRIRVVAIPDPDTGTKVPLFTGTVDSQRDSFGPGGFGPVTSISCVDFMVEWAGFDPPALVTPTGIQTTDERVEAALDRMDWAAGLRSIESGVHSMTSSFLAQSVAEECHRAAEGEGGAFYCAADGSAVFRARDWLLTNERSTAVQGFIGYDAGDPEVGAGDQWAGIVEAVTSWELARVRNVIQLARVGGSVVEVRDEESIGRYRERTFRRLDYQVTDDAELEALAQRMLGAWRADRVRVDSVTLLGNDDPDNEDLNRLFWATEMGDLVDVRVETPEWSIDGVRAHVMGISHRITADEWSMTLKLDDAALAGADYRPVVVSILDPVAWWRFDETAGPDSVDSTVNGHDVTWSGSPTFVGSGSPHGGGLIEVSDDAIEEASVELGDLSPAWSAEAWFLVASDAPTGNERGAVCGWGDDGLLDYNGLVEIDHDGGLDEVIVGFGEDGISGFGEIIRTGVTIERDRFYHLALVCSDDGSQNTVALYLDGVEILAPYTNEFPDPRPVNWTFWMGNHGGSSNRQLVGSLGEVVVYAITLTEDQVGILYGSSY